MKVLGREESWIHTHFLTDCTRLSSRQMRAIEKQMLPVLRRMGIVYGLHFTQLRGECACRVVLECIPFSETLDRIQRKLQDVVQDIPSRPPTTKVTATGPSKTLRLVRG